MSFKGLQRRTARLAAKLFLAPIASRHRRSLVGTRFIAITGSTGKTTTKSLLTKILSSGGEVICNPESANVPVSVLRTLLATRRQHDYCVQELAAWKQGALDWSLRMFEPEVVIVTQIGIDHWSAFGSSDAIAAEKVKAVEALPASGIAILNADDPRVIAMREKTRATIVLYGSSDKADLRLDSSLYSWPGPLNLRMTYRNETVDVQTRLHGQHWAQSVLAATAAALALGSSLDQAATSLASIGPEDHRLSTVQGPSGITFLLDDWKANESTLPCALEVLGSAKGRRRIAILGQIADSRRKPRVLYADWARRARRHADQVLLVGRWARYGLRARTEENDPTIRAFETAEEASQYLRGELRSRDLVLLAAASSSHLSRIALAADGEIDCWLETCGRRIFCDKCGLLRSS